MKKILSFLLASLMLLSIIACDQTTVNENNDISVQPEVSDEPETTEEPEITEEPETTEEPEVSDEPEITEEPEVPEEPETTGEPEIEEPAFDTSWASNDFEKLIPKPPFEGWVGTVESDNVYEMETSKANPDGTLDYYDTWAAYIQTLTDAGFNLTGDVYSAKGTDTKGNNIKLQCGDGYAWITITVKQ